MLYSLLPFPTLSTRSDYEGRPDIRTALTARERLAPTNRVDNLELLDVVVDALRELPWQFFVDHCREDAGDLRVAVTAIDLGRNLDVGDKLNAGFFIQNSELGESELLACSRVYRVACENGYLMECETGQSFALPTDENVPCDWESLVRSVVHRSFDGDGVDVDLARFRATTEQMVLSPYEFLCHLAAQELITEDEQCEIQSTFDEAADYTMYGIINAVTSVAHGLRSDDRWARAFHLERLGGQILRGDHDLPALQPSFA